MPRCLGLEREREVLLDLLAFLKDRGGGETLAEGIRGCGSLRDREAGRFGAAELEEPILVWMQLSSLQLITFVWVRCEV